MLQLLCWFVRAMLAWAFEYKEEKKTVGGKGRRGGGGNKKNKTVARENPPRQKKKKDKFRYWDSNPGRPGESRE